MSNIRPQYHFRKTPTGLDAWDVGRLIRLSAGLPSKKIKPNSITELDLNHWYFGHETEPTPRSILDHTRLILECDIRFPIILDKSGRVMDGMHRVCRAILDNIEELPAVQFKVDPKPDYVDCKPSDLPYG